MREDPKSKKQKKQILEFLEAMDWMFDLSNFDKTILFPEEDEGEKAAKFLLREDYQDVNITIYPRFFEEKKESQRKILLHELCHAITQESRTAMVNLSDGVLVTTSRISDINERETSRIENLLDALLQGRLKYARDAYAKYLS